MKSYLMAYAGAALLLVAGCNQSDTVNMFDFSSGVDLAKNGDMTVKTGDMTKGPDMTTPSLVVVKVSNFKFTPASVQVKIGATVRWEFESAGHTVTSGKIQKAPVTNQFIIAIPDGEFCSKANLTGNKTADAILCNSNTTAPESTMGDTFQFTFNEKGSFDYFCRPHAKDHDMKGEVLVD